jgi:hypothetical protein
VTFKLYLLILLQQVCVPFSTLCPVPTTSDEHLAVAIQGSIIVLDRIAHLSLRLAQCYKYGEI